MKKNCWEHKSCGREPGGPREKELGPCPAALEKKLHGVHGGVNGGRACWAVAGTQCGGAVQGTFAKSLMDCLECDFFKAVSGEEGRGLIQPLALLNMLGHYRGPFPSGGSF
jgi:hypothetical protein